MKKERYEVVYKKEIWKKLNEKFNYPNVMQTPKLLKIVVNRGVGETVENSKAVEIAVEDIRAITGQKPLITKAKKSISNFKIRVGQPIGVKVTLRSRKMYDFLSKLLNIALPKIRDFRGIPVKGFDGNGNYTLGVKEDRIFVEIKERDRARGFDITFVTSAKTNEEAFHLLKFFGMPFREEIKISKG